MTEKLAWAAGFFDGEGSVGAYPGPRTQSGVFRRYLRVSVAQKNPTLLNQFVTIFGCGAVYLDKRRGTHACQFNGAEAFAVMNALWPWLGEQKKGDFKRALQRVHESRAAAVVALQPNKRTCVGCDTEFVPDVRHVRTRYCSTKCYQRAWRRAQRGPAPARFCSACGCHVDSRTRGCRRCMTRHWQRNNKRPKGDGQLGPLQAKR